MAGYPSPTTYRPSISGSHFVAVSGHYLATMAAVRILEMGGNAIDAGVAAGICINVLHPDMTNIGGVAPIMLYSAKEDALSTISGLGTWPANVSRARWMNTDDGSIPTSRAGLTCCMMSFVAATLPHPTSSAVAPSGRAIRVM